MKKTNTLFYFFIFMALVSMREAASGQTLVNFNLNQPAPPVADYSFHGDLDGLNFSFSDSSSTNVISWFWDFGDGMSSTLQNPQHTYATKAIYNVCLAILNDHGCQDTTCKEVNSFTVSVRESGLHESCIVYPNPFNKVLSIRLTLEERSSVSVELYNFMGEKVSMLLNSNIDPGTEDLNFESQTANLKPGVYFMKIGINDEEILERIVKNY